jgi:hypothetical protein
MVMERESMVQVARVELDASLVLRRLREMGMCWPGATASGYMMLGMMRGVLGERARRATLERTLLTERGVSSLVSRGFQD